MNQAFLAKENYWPTPSAGRRNYEIDSTCQVAIALLPSQGLEIKSSVNSWLNSEQAQVPTFFTPLTEDKPAARSPIWLKLG